MIERESEKLEWPVKWGWLLAFGVSLVIFGMFGIALTFYLTQASVILFGALALVSGGFQLWHGLATKETDWSGRITHLLIALVYLAFGGLLIWDPVSGSISLTLALAGFLIVVGMLRVTYAWKCRNHGRKWKLSLVAGLVNLLLAGLIFYGWPGTAFWVIGLFVAIEMMINGWLLIGIAMAARKANREGQNISSHDLESTSDSESTSA